MRLVPVSQPQVLETLEEPAVDEDPGPRRGHQVLGAGNGAGGAEKLDGCHGGASCASCQPSAISGRPQQMPREARVEPAHYIIGTRCAWQRAGSSCFPTT